MTSATCSGFQSAGIASGIKKNGGKDLGLIVSTVPASVAGVYTQNRVQAAPVLLCKERTPSETCRAIIVNSGNANCCTGPAGMVNAKKTARLAAEALGISPDSVLVASTGVIGEPLPADKIETAIPRLTDALDADGFSDVAAAIMTTDTVPKMFSVNGQAGDKTYTITGIAKGAGMIRPDMATMLCFVCTDIGMPSPLLQKALSQAVDRSFNRITIDGDTSTNDTVLLMANGQSGAIVETAAQTASFQKRLDELLVRLARMLVKDGEGATKLVEIIVKGAMSDGDAFQIADTVAHSNLVKTAMFGEDANWGRIIAAAGRSGVPLEPEKIDIYFDDVQMVRNGIGRGKKVEADATAVIKKPAYAIIIDLHMGSGEASLLTCDFSVDYVKINADYRT
jgi:glutamate N-acetyltransferase / amino-acid N-acetyltransferase